MDQCWPKSFQSWTVLPTSRPLLSETTMLMQSEHPSAPVSVVKSKFHQPPYRADAPSAGLTVVIRSAKAAGAADTARARPRRSAASRRRGRLSLPVGVDVAVIPRSYRAVEPAVLTQKGGRVTNSLHRPSE